MRRAPSTGHSGRANPLQPRRIPLLLARVPGRLGDLITGLTRPTGVIPQHVHGPRAALLSPGPARPTWTTQTHRTGEV